MEKQSWFKRKAVTSAIAIIGILTGIFFMGNGTITGNVIVNQYHSVSSLSIIGLLLVFCSVILAVYTVTKKE